MPVGRTEDQDDGRPLRQYRGKPQPLGTLTEWTCPSCGQKISGTAYEAGCPLCGVGTPGQPRPDPQSEPVAAPASQVQPQPGSRQGMASRPDAVRRPVEAQGVGLVVTRIIQYIARPGQEAMMEQTLQRALVGRTGFAWGEIIAAIVDEVSPRQQDILSLANRQPGVWLGGPNYMGHQHELTLHMGETTPRPSYESIVEYQEAPGRDEPTQARPFVGRTGTAMEMPDTGPEFSRLDAEMAKVLLQTCGVKVAYTLALALQSLATASDNTDPLVLDAQDCYALANAIMQLIPKDYVEPELPPPPPPNVGPPSADQEAARARVRAIQEASKPTTSFRE